MRFIVFTLALLGLVMGGAKVAQAQGTDLLPDTAAAAYFQAWLAAFESGDPAALQHYYEANASSSALAFIPAEIRANIESSLYRNSQGLDLHRVIESTDSSLIVLAQSRLTENWMTITLTLEATAPHKVEMIYMQTTDAPAEVLAQPMTEAEIASNLRAYLQKLSDAGVFSGSVMLTHNGEPLSAESYGLADSSALMSNTLDTRFNMASMSKMFTAVAIMQLVEQGLLDVNAPISTYLSDLPADKAILTIHQLLTHTTGLADFFASPLWTEAINSTDTVQGYWPLFINEPLTMTAGTSHQYSNSNFIVLGAIIEAVSGTSYFAYVQQHIFDPLKMTQTGFFERDAEVSHIAVGYTRMDGNNLPGATLRPNTSVLGAKGSPAGGCYTTAADMMRFAEGLRNNSLLSAETTALMLAGKVDSQVGEQYAYGFVVGQFGSVGHSGGFPGASANFKFYPNSGYAFVVLANMDMGAYDVATYLELLLRRLGAAKAITVTDALAAPAAPAGGSIIQMPFPPASDPIEATMMPTIAP